MVRTAALGDAESVARVRTRGWQQAYAHLMPSDYLAGLDAGVMAVAERMRSRMTDQPFERGFFVAVEGERVIGFAMAGAYRVNQNDSRLDTTVGEVYAIYVDPDSWGTGAGLALMDAAVAWLRQRGLRPIRLWVLEGNTRARTFYERYGFTADGKVGVITIEQPGQLPVELPEVRYSLICP